MFEDVARDGEQRAPAHFAPDSRLFQYRVPSRGHSIDIKQLFGLADGCIRAIHGGADIAGQIHAENRAVLRDADRFGARRLKGTLPAKGVVGSRNAGIFAGIASYSPSPSLDVSICYGASSDKKS